MRRVGNFEHWRGPRIHLPALDFLPSSVLYDRQGVRQSLNIRSAFEREATKIMVKRPIFHHQDNEVLDWILVRAHGSIPQRNPRSASAGGSFERRPAGNSPMGSSAPSVGEFRLLLRGRICPVTPERFVALAGDPELGVLYGVYFRDRVSCLLPPSPVSSSVCIPFAMPTRTCIQRGPSIDPRGGNPGVTFCAGRHLIVIVWLDRHRQETTSGVLGGVTPASGSTTRRAWIPGIFMGCLHLHVVCRRLGVRCRVWACLLRHPPCPERVLNPGKIP